MTVFKPRMIAERKLVFLSIAELPSSVTTTHLTVGLKQRRLFMMSLVHQVLMTAEFIRVVDSLNWKSVRFVITAVQMSYSLTDDNYLSLRRLSVISVIRIVFPRQILFYTRERVHLWSAFICLSYLSLYLYYPFLFTYAHY